MARAVNTGLVIQRVGKKLFVELPEGSLVNRGELERVCGAIDQLIDTTDKPDLVLNFSAVKHVSSTFLGRLIAFNKKAKAKGGQLALCNVSTPLNELFTLTKLSSQIPIFKPGEKPILTTVAWVTGFSTMAGSALIGLLLLFYVILNRGFPSRGEPVADRLAMASILWFILTIPVTGVLYFFRRLIVQVGRDVQWLGAAVLAVISLVMFVLFLVAR